MKLTIGEYIHTLRIEKGFTLTQLAAMIGIDSGALSKIENGKKSLDSKCLPKVAEVFSLPLEMLKNDYYSEKIAYEVLANSCSETVFKLAEEKLRYLKQRKSEQSKIEFE